MSSSLKYLAKAIFVDCSLLSKYTNLRNFSAIGKDRLEHKWLVLVGEGLGMHTCTCITIMCHSYR